jgi:hypothetical protein
MPTAALLLRGGVARATLRGMNPEPYLAWAILGVILVIAELVTGTFYLVVLGVAAFGPVRPRTSDTTCRSSRLLQVWLPRPARIGCISIARKARPNR